ncbi:MAG: adenine phosphoribosyltransferase [Gemmatimonadota bacterium]
MVDSRETLISRTRAAIRDVPDFPQPGIIFKDITPVLADSALFRDLIDHFTETHSSARIDVVVGIESRGFIFGAPLAIELGAAFVPFRKPGKLPYQKVRIDYALEYGIDSLEAHRDAIAAGQRVLIVDDVLATGGTAAAALRLVQQMGGNVVGVCFLVELSFLNGRQKLDEVDVQSLLIL